MKHNDEQNNAKHDLSLEDSTYTNTINQEKRDHKRKSTKKGMLTHVLSGITGGVIAATIILMMLITNILPISEAHENQAQASQPESNVQHVSTDVLSEEQPLNIENVTKAVVGVTNLQQQDIWTNSEQAGTGTGVIYKKENGKAYIVTNHHVVDKAEQVEIDLGDGKTAEAKILGTDALSDLAVLEIDGEGVETVAQFASSEKLQVGQTVIAIGNPLGSEFAGTVTKGIISGLNRSIEVDTNGDRQPDWITEVIQTDAAINPGNSGGALVNPEGKVIGINSMKIAQQAVEGIGFAIPSDTALPIIKQLETDGEIIRPLIGIRTAAVNQVPLQYQHKVILPQNVKGGMVIANVQSESPADKAGLKQFDIITKINGEPISTLLDLRVYMYNNTEIGDTLVIEYVREGKLETTELTLINPKESSISE
ncbi:S1C family serine protease [Virgibacillus sp. W0430]|uniref:S1C family serine protease n=1 Tax=Virgibacillus sp. W0430 TaxID=3391580 RepID=UPI003F4846E0